MLITDRTLNTGLKHAYSKGYIVVYWSISAFLEDKTAFLVVCKLPENVARWRQNVLK